MNKNDLRGKIQTTVQQLIQEKGYASALDLLVRMGKVTPKQVEDWRFGRVPYLERVVQGSLGKCSSILSSMREIAEEMGLNASYTAYMKWGKGPKQHLRFSKSGNPHIERQYATHFVSRKLTSPELPAVSSETESAAADRKAGAPR